MERRLQDTRSRTQRKQRAVDALHASIAAAQRSLEQHSVRGKRGHPEEEKNHTCLPTQPTQEATAALQRQLGDSHEQGRQAAARKRDQLRAVASTLNTTTNSTWATLEQL